MTSQPGGRYLVRKYWIAGVTISDSSIEMRIPPITAMASSWSICDQATATASGSMPATAASAVMTIGRNRRRPAERSLPPAKADRPELLVGIEEENPVLGDDADHHDQAHERRDVERRPRHEQGKEDPDVERMADDRIAIGGVKDRNSNSSEKDQHDR